MSNNVIRNSIVFYTDGSSLGKPKKKGKRAAGCGVFFAPNDPRNYGGALGPDPQTNQRAELAAIWEGLTRIKFTDHATIYTDSEYAMFAPTSRYYTQKRNSWKTPEGKPVPNIDLIEPIFQLLVLRKASGATTDLRWLKGHSGYPGNEAADRLAAEGAEYVVKSCIQAPDYGH
ncbi:uncharacterized protein J4E84_006740 [Alternaria hordeiaustralica]|uniref:uncharacterized protein n=1 Tax=Alternaria hordeiaustralica TaxID=1187925 RepID=UPI0020C32A28|nr:uncharacterized protein J4E84_006740 [Alternaria hordeiaustralica]KAI4683900.1 hypothetical protein J4E84_006740 [Alternaria hordeiaustralica]